MIESVRNAFSLPDLRRRILFTLGMLVVYRLGANIPVPGVNLEAWLAFTSDQVSGNQLSTFLICCPVVLCVISRSWRWVCIRTLRHLLLFNC